MAVLICTAGSIATAAPDDRAARYYEDALSRYESRDIAGAVIQLKNALQLERDMLPVHVLLGKALLANGEVGAAEVAFSEALRLGVNRAEVVVPLAETYMAQGKQRDVLTQPQFNPAALPPAIQVPLLLLRAASSADLGDARAALRSIDEARAIDPKSAEAWLAEVPVRIRARQFREAGEAVAKALALAPASAAVWYHKGSIAHVQGDLASALAAYDRALQADASHLEALVSRAGLLVDLGRHATAAADVEALRRISPQEPRAAYLRALLAEHAGDAAAAQGALREVTAFLDPVPPEYIRYRPQLLMLNGLAHFGLGEWQKAKPYLESYQRVQGNSATSKVLAQIHLRERNAGFAIDVLEPYLRAQPGDAQAITLLASAHMAQGRHAKAGALMQEALRAKDTPALRTALGLALLGAGQSRDAVAALEAAYKKDPAQTQAGAALVGLYLGAGQVPKALGVAQNLAKRQPANASFKNLLGLAMAQAGDSAGARAAFEQALQLDGTQIAAQLNLARLDVAAESFDAAAARLDGLLEADGKNVDVLLERAALAGQRGQPGEVQRWLEKANDHAGPRELRPGLALVDFHLRGGRGSAALEMAKRLVSKAPDEVAVLVSHARALLANGDAAGARTTLTNATRLANFGAPAQVEIAALQLAASNMAGAAYSLEKALSAQPDFVPAMALMVEVELRQGELSKAEQRARRVLQREPKRAVGHGLLGNVALARGQPAAAISAYRQAHQAEPSSETLLRLLRASFVHEGAKAALPLGEQWLEAQPQDIAVRKAVADGHAASANYVAARGAYEALLKLVPDDAEVLNNIANVLLRTKDPEALKYAELALARDPGNPVVIDTLGWASHHAGQNDRALQLLRDARLRDPGNAEIRFHLATVLAKTGRTNEAREELTVALGNSRSLESTGEAEALLKSLK